MSKDVVLGRGVLCLSLFEARLSTIRPMSGTGIYGQKELRQVQTERPQRGTLLWRPDPPKRRKAGKP